MGARVSHVRATGTASSRAAPEQFNDNPFVDVRYTQTEHSGLLSGDERWRGSFVHHVTGDVTVPSGVTLTIDAGAVVKFDAYKGLIVQPGGHLIALGSVARADRVHVEP